MEKRFINIDEFTEIYGLSKSTQAEYRRKRKIPFIKIGMNVRYDKQKIDEWFEAHAIEATGV